MFESIVVTNVNGTVTDWECVIDGFHMYNGRFSSRNMTSTCYYNDDHGQNLCMPE